MPKSRIRKKADYTPPPSKQATAIKLNSRGWVAPVMLAMFLIGLAWIVIFYVTDGSLPIDSLGNWADTARATRPFRTRRYRAIRAAAARSSPAAC